jgi:alanine racemase
MNRLGLDWRGDVAGQVGALQLRTLLSHLASADEDKPLSRNQLERFTALRLGVAAERYSLANSAGICLGPDYAFDMTRPGLALYGGIPRREAAGSIRQVVFPEAQVLQRRRVLAGDAIGYNATHVATAEMEIAIVNLGYADGYLRGFSDRGTMYRGDDRLPVVGRVSMDLTAVDVSNATDIAEGDWLTVDYALPDASAISGLSQYELLTGLGVRFDRMWD